MKIMSVMPAAAASSTAYWISGLSTTGSISVGLAFVAGSKRVPIPATGNTAFVILRIVMIRPRVGLWSSGFCRAGLEEFPESFFVHDRYAKLLRLRELASRFLAGHDVIGLLRYAAGDFAAFRLDHRLGIVARELRQRSRQHERKPCELAHGRAHRHRVAPVHPGLAQGIDHLAIVPLGGWRNEATPACAAPGRRARRSSAQWLRRRGARPPSRRPGTWSASRRVSRSSAAFPKPRGPLPESRRPRVAR